MKHKLNVFLKKRYKNSVHFVNELKINQVFYVNNCTYEYLGRGVCVNLVTNKLQRFPLYFPVYTSRYDLYKSKLFCTLKRISNVIHCLFYRTCVRDN